MLKRSVGEESVRDVLEKSVVKKFWIHVAKLW